MNLPPRSMRTLNKPTIDNIPREYHKALLWNKWNGVPNKYITPWMEVRDRLPEVLPASGYFTAEDYIK